MEYINKDFLLENETAKKLYHKYCEELPIIDYHCHLNPMEIAENKKFRNITELWLGGDHYKWRLIRACGVPENEITGDASDWTKFYNFAKIMPRIIGNPLYQWTHLELKRYFGYDGLLNEETAETVWNLCNSKLENMTVRQMMEMSNVIAVATTDDPVDDLKAHEMIAADKSFNIAVIPAWRPDKAVNIDKDGFVDYIAKLADVSKTEIKDFESLMTALVSRLEYFNAHGCCASDHGLDFVPYAETNTDEVDAIFRKALSGEKVTADEAEKYKCFILNKLHAEYVRLGWASQLHYGAVRNVNTAKFAKLGPDTGFDCIGNSGDPVKITSFLNSLAKDNNLPRTVIYSTNPNDNYMLVALMNSFQDDSCRGKLQHGSAWWFNDTYNGMRNQLTALAEDGVLGNFIGMLTDSRSFISYPRHEYFRRLLCNLIGEWAESGKYPNDEKMLGKLVSDISFYNCKEYFGF